VQHRWVLGFFLGASSSVRDYLNSLFLPFLCPFLVVTCQDVHAPCKIHSFCADLPLKYKENKHSNNIIILKKEPCISVTCEKPLNAVSVESGSGETN
jgi:hypothetical protein